jgi:hypothetical protein
MTQTQVETFNDYLRQTRFTTVGPPREKAGKQRHATVGGLFRRRPGWATTTGPGLTPWGENRVDETGAEEYSPPTVAIVSHQGPDPHIALRFGVEALAIFLPHIGYSTAIPMFPAEIALLIARWSRRDRGGRLG